MSIFSLGRRFSVLARTGSPDVLKQQLVQLRADGAEGSLTLEEEQIILEELRQLREIRDQNPTPTSSTPSSQGYNPHSGHPLRSRSNASDVSYQSSSSFFGGHNNDPETFRRAKRSMSVKSFEEGNVKGRSKHGRQATSTSIDEHTSSDGQLSKSSSSSLVSETNSRFEDPSGLVPASAETALPSKRKSLLDGLSSSQLDRITHTLACIEENVDAGSVGKKETTVGDVGSKDVLDSSTVRRGEAKHLRLGSAVSDRVEGYM